MTADSFQLKLAMFKKPSHPQPWSVETHLQFAVPYLIAFVLFDFA